MVFPMTQVEQLIAPQQLLFTQTTTSTEKVCMMNNLEQQQNGNASLEKGLIQI